VDHRPSSSFPCHLGTLEFAAQRAHVSIRVIKLSLLESGSKVRDGVIVPFIMESDACARA
jgi:hypothetical protein